MNVSDSERVATSLIGKGFEMTDSHENADIVLINTCSVRDKAEQKLYHKIGRIRKRRKVMPMIGVLGCVAQLEGETLYKKIDGLDFILGTRAVGRVTDAIENVLNDGPGFTDLGEREADYDWNVTDKQRHSPYIAFVPIIEGCNKFCTYCIVPFSRGRERSLLASEIIRQVLELRRHGVKEVHLIGQNVNSYRPMSDSGMETFEGKTPFSKLLRAVASTGIKRIKFNTSFPRDFHPDIVDAIDENENLCNWVHLPVQSGSDKVLKTMRRLHSIESYFKRIDKLRSAKREISLSTDIIVGFPGETDNDFQDTVSMIEYCNFDSSYIYKYSPRPGTPAFEMIDDVSPATKTARFDELASAQKTLQTKNLMRYMDRTVNVLAERRSSRSSDHLTGHSSCHKIVNFAASDDMLGSITEVKITEIKSNSLFGELN